MYCVHHSVHHHRAELFNRNGVEFGGVRSTCRGYAAEERGRGSTESGSGERNAADRIEDKDFRAEFDGERWTVEWFWKGEPPTLTNKVSCYENTLKGEARGEFEREVDRWIEEGILSIEPFLYTEMLYMYVCYISMYVYNRE